MGTLRPMFGSLLSHEGVVEHCLLRSKVGFMALHGGLEAATFEIARAAANRSDASLYAVVQPAELSWHVPSHRFDPAQSENLAMFCKHVDVVMSIHGYGGVRDSPLRWTTILLGGAGREAARTVGERLRSRLPEYVVLDDLDAIPSQYRGVDPRNPVNLVNTAGVQIELPPRIRGTSPKWSAHDRDSDGWVPHTRSLITALAESVPRLE